VTNVGNVFKRPVADIDKRRRLRKDRQRSISDGVQFMRNFNEADMARSFPGKGSPLRLSDAAAVRLDSVNENQAFQQPPLADNADAQKIANPTSTSMPPSQQRREERIKERRRLRKSQSDNVAFMRAMNSAGLFALDTSTSPQRRQLANNSMTSAHISVPLSPIKAEARTQREKMEETNEQMELNDHPKSSPEWFRQEELSPIKVEEEDTKERNDDNEFVTPPNLNGNNKDDAQVESLNDHPKPSPQWFAQEELSPIKLEEKDMKERDDDDDGYNDFLNFITPPSLNENDKDEFQAESPSKSLLPPPTNVSNSRAKKSGAFTKDDFFIPAGRRAPREDTTPHGAANASEILDRKQERRRQRRLATRSEGVAFMRSTLADTDNLFTVRTTSLPLASVCELGEDAQLETLAGLAKLSTKDLPEIPPFEGKRRRPRHRSASDGVSSMRMMNLVDTDSPKSLVLTEDKETVKQSSTKALSVSTDKKLPFGKNPDLFLDKDQAKPSNRVSFALFHSSSASNALSSPTDRLSSIDSAASVDGDSDIDDVPDALSVDVSAVTPSKHMLARPRIDLDSFFQGAKYRAASFLYGPMICMLMIG
jgi:hypothetical protein